jgi:hypothetical protein
MIDILSHFHFLKKIVRILENQYLFWGFFVWFFCFGGGGVGLFSRQGFSVQPWLSWNSLCRPGWPRTQKSACLCLPSAGIKGVRHHRPAVFLFMLKFTFFSKQPTLL